MQPDDPRHGSVAGYRAGCRNECCRAGIRRYNEVRKLNKIRGLPTSTLVDATGTRRRLQALMALGWSVPQLRKHLNMDAPFIRRVIRENQLVSNATQQRVLEVYERLSMTLPPMTTRGERQGATRARNYASRNGWVGPLMWDDIDSDAGPIVDTKFYKKNFIRDEVAIQRVLDGDDKIARHLTPAEREEVVRRWTGSLAELERVTGWNVHRYTRNDAA